jgi:hypothetical protein
MSVPLLTADIHQDDGYVSFVPTTEVAASVGASSAQARSIGSVVYSANLGAAVMRRTFVRPRSEENNEWRMMIAPR